MYQMYVECALLENFHDLQCTEHLYSKVKLFRKLDRQRLKFNFSFIYLIYNSFSRVVLHVIASCTVYISTVQNVQKLPCFKCLVFIKGLQFKQFFKCRNKLNAIRNVVGKKKINVGCTHEYN